MPDRGGRPRKAKADGTTSQTDDRPPSGESILSIVEAKMSQVFDEQYEDVKDKLITLMAKDMSKWRGREVNIEEDIQAFKATTGGPLSSSSPSL